VFECAHLCGQAFEKRYHKEQHMKTCPRPKEPVDCPFGCGRNFSLRGALRHKRFCDKNPNREPKRSWKREPSPMLAMQCADCGANFSKRNNGHNACDDGVVRCDGCKVETYRGRYRSKSREWRLQNYYGIGQDEYERILRVQGGCCAICKRLPSEGEKAFAVDHCHKSGRVRGVLCHSCNLALGVFKDDLINVRATISYLLRFDPSRSWDDYFIDLARMVATRSKDPSSQVGAVIVRDRNILSTGYNGFPRGVNDDRPERYERPTKYLWIVHGEENAILNAGRNGTATEGSTLYVTPFAPCVPCAKAIIQSGIREVVIDALIENPRWADEFAEADAILKAAKVIVRGPE